MSHFVFFKGRMQTFKGNRYYKNRVILFSKLKAPIFGNSLEESQI